MTTKKFIKKVHDAFDALNYHETNSLDLEAFDNAAVNTLTHCAELSDAIVAVRMYQFCLKKWNKIKKIFNRRLQEYNEYDYKGNSLISTVSDDDALGTFYITNAINRKIKEIFVASHSLDEKTFALGFEHGRFTVFTDGKYYMKYSKASSVKMKLFNNKNQRLCDIVLNKNLGIFLENNSTPYELIVYDDFIGIYDRRYIESLADTDLIDTDKLLAHIEWNILEKNSKFGVAKLNLYDYDQDLEMLLFFATSTFLIFQRYKYTQEAAVCTMMNVHF